MSSASPTAAQIASRVAETLTRTLTRELSTPLYETLVQRWLPTLSSIAHEAERPPTVAVALVGGTGAGKSTLINAILGARVLPVSNARACTAAISEVTHSAEGFAAEIEFISRTTWLQEVGLLLGDLADERRSDDSDVIGNSDGVSKAARDRLKAVYSLNDEQIRPGLKPEMLEEPIVIRDALDSGVARVEADNADDFRDRLRRYLDSKYEFWPLVKAARISGPFTGLTVPGVRLVDLPGLNDPNEAREEVTRRYLKESRFVWIVFNIKRALTRDIQSIMQSEDFARQIVLDGRDDALTFVGTASDDVDRESGIDEFGLNDDAVEAEIVAARNRAVRSVIQEQLDEIAHRLAQGANEPDRAKELAERLKRSKVFTVSARDYLHLRGIAKNKISTLDDTAQTEVPTLREHLAAISSGFTDDAHQAGLLKQLKLVTSEIRHALNSEQRRIANARELSVQKRKEIGSALLRLLNFLRRDLDDHADRFRQEVNAKHELLEERLKRGFDRGRSELRRVTENWKRIHWATLKAIVRRNGKFTSPTSGHYDFAEDISRPVLESITFAWSDFFGDKMSHTMEVWSDRLVSLAERHRIGTLKEVAQVVGTDSSQLAGDLDSSLKVTERLMKEYLGQSQTHMAAQLDDVRSSLYGQIPRQVSANMQKAYDAASNESGTGTKQRIIERLSAHAFDVSKVMFDDSRSKITEGVRMVTDSLARKYKEMSDSVYERLALPTANFSAAEAPPDEVTDSILHRLQEAASQLDAAAHEDGEGTMSNISKQQRVTTTI